MSDFCLSLFDTIIDRNVFCSLILINLETGFGILFHNIDIVLKCFFLHSSVFNFIIFKIIVLMFYPITILFLGLGYTEIFILILLFHFRMEKHHL